MTNDGYDAKTTEWDVPSSQTVPTKIPAKHILLALAVMPMLSGVLPILGRYSSMGLRAFWILFCIILAVIAQSAPIRKLLSPMGPYLAWLAFYLILGVIVSPIPVLPKAITIIFYTIVFAISMAIFVQKYKHLHFFANCTQWILFFNILFLLLVVIYPSFQSIVTPDALAGDAYEASKERFAGLWGNPNMAGYVCVVVIILSTWATRWVAWVGRISGVAIIYFSASRKAALLLTIIFLMNILIVQRRNIKAWLLVGAGALIVVVPFLFDNRVMGSSVSRLANDQKLSRMVDLSESQSGDDESRVALLKHWIPIVSAAPWYGYGLGSMAGYDSQGRIPRKELFITGTHNTYLGIWVDVGPIGLIAFLGVFSIYIYRYLVSSFSPTTRWALLSLMVCNILILTVSHNHLFCAEGIMAFSLFFLLPTSPALMGEEAWEASA